MPAASPAAAVSAVLTVTSGSFEGAAEDHRHSRIIIDDHNSTHGLLGEAEMLLSISACRRSIVE
jgi:hypothetical protein